MTTYYKTSPPVRQAAGTAATLILAATALLLAALTGSTVSDRLVFSLTACAVIALCWWRRPETIALLFFALAPAAGYLLRYPEEQALLTFERAMTFILALAVTARLARDQALSLRVGWLEACWLAFALYALADCVLRGLAPASLKIAVDAFLLPLIVFTIARQALEGAKTVKALFVALIVIAYALLPIGLYELITGHDLLQFPGSDLTRDGIIRPNGPYLSDNSYALISLIVALALYHWPRLMGEPLTLARRLVWMGAIASALAASATPQFRAVAIAAVASFALSRLLARGWRALIAPALLAMLLAAIALPFFLVVRDSELYRQRLADPTNFYSRLVTYRIALTVARDNWARGVGLGRYESYFAPRYAPKEATTKREMRRLQRGMGSLPQSTPHNNYLSVLAELGLPGFTLYTVANLLILIAGWRLRKSSNERERAAGTAVISLHCAYTLVGLTLTTGYYGDLNISHFFLIGLLLNSKRSL